MIKNNYEEIEKVRELLNRIYGEHHELSQRKSSLNGYKFEIIKLHIYGSKVVHTFYARSLSNLINMLKDGWS